jgi:hypothetical protein
MENLTNPKTITMYTKTCVISDYHRGSGSFTGVKRLGRGADHPLPSSAEAENE